MGDFAEFSKSFELVPAELSLEFLGAFLCLACNGVRQPEECGHEEHGKYCRHDQATHGGDTHRLGHGGDVATEG